MRKIIVGTPGDVLQGGNPKNGMARDPFLQDTDEDHIIGVDQNTAQNVVTIEVLPATSSTQVKEKAKEILSFPEKVIRLGQNPNLAHLMVATALANAADGVSGSLKQ